MIRTLHTLSLVLTTCILLFGAQSHAQTDTQIVIEKNAIVKKGLQLVYDAHYDAAIKQFRLLDKVDTLSAEGIFFESFVLELIMDVYRSQIFDDSLKIVVEKAIPVAKAAIEANPTARNYMYLGGLYGVIGVRKGILGSWFSAAMDGRKANKNFEKALEIDPVLYDCFYGIGSYHYWKTKKLKRFFGFFIRDKREQGIEEIQSAIEKGVFAETPGRMALFRIFVEEKRYEDVFDLAEKVLTENPDHLFPRWYLGISFIKTEQWEKARDNYNTILDILPGVEFRGVEAEIEAQYYAGLANYNLGDFIQAKQLLESIPQYKDKVNQHLFYYDNYIKKSSELLKKMNKR